MTMGLKLCHLRMLAALARRPCLVASMLVTGQASAQTVSGTHRLFDFTVSMPDNSDVVILAIILLGTPLAAYAIYRMLLKGTVQKGVHPSHLSAALWLWALFAVSAIPLLLPWLGFGMGWFVLSAALLSVTALVFIVSRVVIVTWAAFLLILLVLIVGSLAGGIL